MKYTLLLLAVLGGCTQAPVLTIPDRAGLGSYLAFCVVTSTDTTTPDNAPPAPNSETGCPECGDPATGLVGDGTIMLPCPNPDCPARRSEEPPTISEDEWDEMINSIEPEEVRIKPVRMARSRWTVAGRSSYTLEYLASPLRKEHGFEPAGYTKTELQTIHDNLHEGFDALGESSASCPDGNCPVPSSSSRSTSSCPGGNCPSPSRSRGFFFRR